MIDETSYDKAPQSRIEAILLAIKNNTQYSHLPHSRIEEILLAIKNNTSYDKESMSRIEEILLAKLNSVEYKKPVQSKIEKLLLKWLYQDLYLTLKGVPPLTFTANGQPLVDWTIYGNTINGESVGDRTANLFNGDLQKGYWINTTDLGQTSSEAFRSFKIFLPAGTYTLSFEINVNIVRLIADGTLTQNAGNNLAEYTVTTQTDGDIGFSFRLTGTTQVPWDNSDIMLNEGSTALPYEPYCYKVPVTVTNEMDTQTTNIYLPEQIKKVGDEAEYIDYGEQKQHRVRKNLLKNTATSQTINGLTFTVHTDGRVTCNGRRENTSTIFYNLEALLLQVRQF
jgi:hypothetical protein